MLDRRFENISENGVDVYSFPALKSLGYKAFVSGRGGGVSPAPYNSLNTDDSVGDDARNVEENLRRIAGAAGVESVWMPRQVHGDAIAVMDSSSARAVREADAVVVSTPGVAVAVRTADCLPILLADKKARAGAAIHAGRRSTEARIAGKTIRMMAEKFMTVPGDLVAALGPCIRSCCYEVDEDTARNFYDCCGGSGSVMLDIVVANVKQLIEAGISPDNIIDCGVCVSCESHRFFSYRADGGVTGRFISGITIT